MKTKAFLTSVLAGSIAQLVQGATIDSASPVVNGNWSDPASWVGGTFPDTYSLDSAVIHLGDSIIYDDISGGVGTPAGPMTTPAGLAGQAGGLAVGLGNSLFIDGGSLTQTTLLSEIRIGEGTGGASGDGVLTIDNGGVLDTGSSVGLAVGSSLLADSGTPSLLGSGIVNLNNGLLRLGAGAAAGGLGVGLNGSVGVFNLGDGSGAAGEAVLDLATNNIQMGIGTQFALGVVGGTGTFTIKSDGLLNLGTSDIVVGNVGGTGTLTVMSGGSLTGTTGGRILVGSDELTNGTLDLQAGGTISITGEIRIGSGGGTGTLTMNGGALTTTGELNIGRGVGPTPIPALGTASITGGNATSNLLFVGRDGGTGSLAISGTAVVDSQQMFIGENGGATGVVNITAGGTYVMHGYSRIGLGAGSTGTLNINGVGSQLLHSTVGGDMQIGYNGGTGNVNVTNGGKLVQNWWFNVARGAGSVGNVVLDGAGSLIDVSDPAILDPNRNLRTNIGEDGTGTMTVSHDAVFANTELFVGRNGGSLGTLNINTGGKVTTDQWLEIGASSARDGNGAVIATATGVINIDGPGSTLTHLGVIGGRNGGGGGDSQIGHNGGTGTLNVTNGGTFQTGWWLNIARNDPDNPNAGDHLHDSVGVVNIDGVGSKVVVGYTGLDAKVNIGEDGTGTMTLTNGAELFSGVVGGAGDHELLVGRNSGSTGTLNILSGSTVHSDGNWTRIGQSGTGTMNVDGGGKFLGNNWIVIGNESGSVGTVTIDGATSLIDAGANGTDGRVITGRLGVATFNQLEGTVKANNWFAVGIDNGGTGTYNMSGGKILLGQPNYGDRQVVVGNNGNGTMNISYGTPAGDTIASSINDANHGTRINYFNVGGDSTGHGVLNINLSDPAGKIISRELYAGWSSNGNLSTGVINVTSGILQTDGWVEIGRGNNNNGGTGTVNIDGPNARWERGVLALSSADGDGARDMNFGQGEQDNIGKGYLNVLNGGTVNTNWWINLARQPHTEGHIVLDGVGSSINMVDAHTHGLGGDGNSQLNVGQQGIGTLLISNGAVFNHSLDLGGGEVHIGRTGGSNGTMTIDGVGSAFHSNGRDFRIAPGYDIAGSAVGTLNITNGGSLTFSSHNEDGNIGNGHFLIAQNNQAVGTINMDHGSLIVDAWAFDSAWEDNAAGSVATVNTVNSSIEILNGSGDHGRLLWARRGTATINQSGGSVHVANWAVIGVEPGGRGNYNLTGSPEGDGIATFDNQLDIGRSGGIGKVDVGAGGVMSVAGWTTVGGRDGNAGSGTLTVHDGGVFQHLVNVPAAGAGDFLIGWTNGSTGAVNVINGGAINYNWWVRTGIDRGSTGSILVDNNSTWNSDTGRFYIGESGTGSLTITNNSSLVHTNADQFNVGGNDGGDRNGHGTLTVDATSMLSTSNWFRVGHGLDREDPPTPTFGQPATGVVNLIGGVINVGTWAAFGHEGGDGTLNMSGGLFTAGNEFYVGIDDNGRPRTTTGTVNLTGGTITSGGGGFVIGRAGGVGIFNVTGTDPIVMSSNNETHIGQGGLGAGGSVGNGTLNFGNPNATMTVTNGLYVGQEGGIGTVNQTSGSIVETNQWVTLGSNGAHINDSTGTYNISGGTLQANILEVGADGNGFLNISETGQVIANAITVGTRTTGVGTISVSGGLLKSNDHISLGGDQGDGAGVFAASETGTLNLTGGVVQTTYIRSFSPEGSTVSLNMDGGTLRANNNETDFLRGFDPANSEVLAGGVIFDTNGFNIAVNNQFDGVGGLVKEGEGNLTVTNAANANTGGTIVNRGNAIYPVISAAGPGTVDILINAPGAAALDGTDLTPLQARTITTSNGAIALHDNTATVPLDFSAYPNLSLGSVGTSSYDLALTPGGGNYRLGGGGGTLTVSTVLTGANGLVVNGNGLKGTVILTSQETYTGPTNVANGIAILASGVNTLPATALTIGATATVGLNGNNQTVGSLAGAAGAVLNNSGAAAVFTTGVDNTSTIYDGLITGNISVVKIGTGTQTISAAQTYSALSVNAGAVVLGGSNHLGALSLAAGTTATLTTHAGGPANIKVIETSALTLAGNAKLDLTNNAMIVRGGDYATLLAKTVSGFNGSAWDGVGINSSSAATEPDGRTAIAIVNNADLGFSSFAGVTGLTGNEILFKYTYYGDADLDGNAGAEDFSAFLQGFTGAAPASWLTGDFNYDGAVGAEDFSAFLGNFSTVLPQLRDEALTEQMNSFALQLSTGGSGAIGDSGSSVDGGSPTAGQAVVPEPGSIGLLAAGALGLIARRRRGTPRN